MKNCILLKELRKNVTLSFLILWYSVAFFHTKETKPICLSQERHIAFTKDKSFPIRWLLTNCRLWFVDYLLLFRSTFVPYSFVQPTYRWIRLWFCIASFIIVPNSFKFVFNSVMLFVGIHLNSFEQNVWSHMERKNFIKKIRSPTLSLAFCHYRSQKIIILSVNKWFVPCGTTALIAIKINKTIFGVDI